MSEPKVTYEGFMHAMPEMPLNWKCVRCGVTHLMRIHGAEHPWGFQFEDVIQPNGDVLRRVVGDLCRNCMEGAG